MIIIYHSLNWFNMWYFYQINETILCIFIDLRDKLILKGSLDLIPSPSPSEKNQIMGRKVWLRHKGKTLLVVVWKQKNCWQLTSPSSVLPYYLKLTLLPIIWIFTKSEGDGIESRLSFQIFSTLPTWEVWLFDQIHTFFFVAYSALQ